MPKSHIPRSGLIGTWPRNLCFNQQAGVMKFKLLPLLLVLPSLGAQVSADKSKIVIDDVDLQERFTFLKARKGSWWMT